MLLRETNEHRRQDREIQHRIREAAQEKAGLGGKVHAARLHKVPEEAQGQRKARALQGASFRCAGQDPQIHGDLAFASFGDETEHGEQSLPSRSERESARLVPPVPFMAWSCTSTRQDHQDPKGNDSSPPDDTHVPPQLPSERATPDVSLPPYLTIWRALMDCIKPQAPPVLRPTPV